MHRAFLFWASITARYESNIRRRCGRTCSRICLLTLMKTDNSSRMTLSKRPDILFFHDEMSTDSSKDIPVGSPPAQEQLPTRGVIYMFL